MADTPGNPNESVADGQQQQQQAVTPTPEDIKKARRSLLDKFEVESSRAAIQTPQQSEGDDGDDGDDSIDLSGLDPAVAARIKAKLNRASRQSKHVNTLATYGLEQASRAKALEIGQEFKLDSDEITQVQKVLAKSRTPDEIDLAGRELAIKLREDGSVQVQTPAAPQKKNDPADGTNPPPVDQGRGGGSNRTAALIDALDAIDPYGDPAKNEQEMAKLKKDADAAQARFMERAARGR